MDDNYSTDEVNTSTYTLENRAPPKLIGRYLKLFPLGHHPYHRQTEYPGRWPKAYNPYTAQELVDHLDPDTDVWIASRALRDRRGPYTYFLMLDFDNKGDVPAEERLTRVTKEFGIEPQVWTSPGGGYHAYWFFDGPTRLVNLMQGSGSHTQGLVPDLITQALERKGGPGIVEVFPQQGQVMRWPLGRRQHLVNTENWSTTILTPEEKIAAAEEYRETTPLLSYQYLKKLKRDKPTITVLPYTPSDQRLDQDEVVRLFKEGLNRRGTRNNSTYLVAQAMVTLPELLEPFGFDTEGDVVEQMRVWMLKHNGFSVRLADMVPDDPWLRQEAQRVIKSAQGATQNEFHRVNPTLVTSNELETILAWGAELYLEPSVKRFRFEQAAYSILRKGKSVARYHSAKPKPNEQYLAEISHEWWEQIPNLRNRKSRKHYREKLEECGICTLFYPADNEEGIANIYAMWLDFENDRVEPPITDPKLSELAKTLGKDLPTLEFELIIASRFSRAEMTELYGRKTSSRLHKQFVALLCES